MPMNSPWKRLCQVGLACAAALVLTGADDPKLVETKRAFGGGPA